jgi:hypothetical protein
VGWVAAPPLPQAANAVAATRASAMAIGLAGNFDILVLLAFPFWRLAIGD